MKNAIWRDVAAYGVVQVEQHFGGPCFLYLQFSAL